MCIGVEKRKYRSDLSSLPAKIFQNLGGWKKGLKGEHLGKRVRGTTLERETIGGNSPVPENSLMLLDVFLKYLGKRKSRGKQAGLHCQG